MTTTEDQAQAKLDKLALQLSRGIITKQEFDDAVRRLSDDITKENSK